MTKKLQTATVAIFAALIGLVLLLSLKPDLIMVVMLVVPVLVVVQVVIALRSAKPAAETNEETLYER